MLASVSCALTELFYTPLLEYVPLRDIVILYIYVPLDSWGAKSTFSYNPGACHSVCHMAGP